MRILIAHNFYQQPGGEDAVFAAEAALLESRANHVGRFTVHNDGIGDMGRLAVARKTLWNGRMRDAFHDRVRDERIDVVHFHNTFPLISPAAYRGAREAGAAVVQTLHNYRLLCPNALLFRSGKPCEQCVGKLIAWPGVVHACYRGSRSASAMVALMLAAHQLAGTWQRDVDLYIAPSEFTRRKFCEAGLPESRIIVKPHFVYPDPGPGRGDGGYAVFLGRLSEEKGLQTLLRAWSLLRNPPPLRIIGDGPLAPLVRDAVSARIEWMGRQSTEMASELLGRGACLILPSPCYETFGRVIAEAFAKGTPVIASDAGALAEMVDRGRTGLLFRAGDEADLARQVENMFSDAARLAEMRCAVREEYLEKYGPEDNYDQLLRIYFQATSIRGTSATISAHYDELGRWEPA